MRSLRSGAAIAAAVALLMGCSSAPKDDLASRVERIVADSGHRVITRVSILDEPSNVRVVLRTPAGERLFDATGELDREPGGIPVGGSRPDAIDYELLSSLWDELASSCSESPGLSMVITATGAMLTETSCDDRAVASTVDGRDLGPAAIDLLSVAGIEQLMAEADAVMPRRGIYMFSLPGPASARGDLARVDGQLWALADGSECGAVYLRPGVPDAERPWHGFNCTSGGRMQSDGDLQEAFAPSSIDAQRLHDEMAIALAASGFDASDIALYFYYQLSIMGEQLLLVTGDDRRYTHTIGSEG